MKTKMFSVYDSKMTLYGTPFFTPREAVAKRMFKDLVSDSNTTVSKNPEDFSLYYLGEFDDEFGTFDSVKPTNLCTASAIVVDAPVQLEMKV